MAHPVATATSVTVVAVDPLDPADDALFAAWHATAQASGIAEFGDLHTVYSMEEIRAEARTIETERVERFAVVAGDGTTAGAAEPGTLDAPLAPGVLGAPPAPLALGAAVLYVPLRDNPHLVWATVDVHPDHRRRGVGTTLIARLEARCRELGRRTLTIDGARSSARPDVMSPFARRLGYESALVTLRNDLDLERATSPGATSPGALAAVALGSAPPGYRFVTWWDDVPDAWVEQQAALTARMSTDAPLGDLALQPEVWDADRVREQWRIARDQGRRLVETAAVHEQSGALVAYTSMAVPRHTPHLAYQWDTLVLREHRGHGLGLSLKHANLRALRAELPAVRRIVTWNAASNEPMLRVNRALGFEAVGTMIEWQKHL